MAIQTTITLTGLLVIGFGAISYGINAVEVGQLEIGIAAIAGGAVCVFGGFLLWEHGIIPTMVKKLKTVSQ